METTTIKQLNSDIRQHEKNENIDNFNIDNEINLIGWVRSCRDNGKVIFISFNDGSRLNSIQLVSKQGVTENHEEIKNLRFGSSILATGKPILTTDSSQQKFEIILSKVKILKLADENFPIQKKEHSMEFLRDVSHIRTKTNTFFAVMKLRSELSFAIHNFFHLNNFLWLSSPIITSNDAEGAGESFKIVDDEGSSFFGDVNASLTVSGQLHAEAYAQSFKRVYTFGPTFRAEKSHTTRHLAEFWMVESEIAFCDLNQLMFLIESFIKFLVKIAQKKCYEEINFIEKNINPSINQRLTSVLECDFSKIEYKRAIEILNDSLANGTSSFEDKEIYFGKDLKTEHERYLCEVWSKNTPVFIYNYPISIKSFYMKQNTDNNTVAACDLLFPNIGELVGGSQREDDYEKIVERCNKLNMSMNDIQWYLDLRKYGYYKSSGFGLGFERLLLYITGLENIKDVIPFPRSNGVLKF